MEKFKTFAENAIQKVRNAKFAVGALTASAALPIITVAASAQDPDTTNTVVTSGLGQYSTEIQSTFTTMVSDVMPIAIGVLSAGAAIFGLFIAWKLARKALSSVTK